MRTIFCITILVLMSFTAQAKSMEYLFRTIFFDHNSGSLHLRIGIQEPDAEPIGDVVYVHGFADRLDNHGPLFDAWAAQGLRVISFDLPSHGENSGSYNDLNKFTFENLAKLAARVENITKPQDLRRPLILAGWSTGGLIVVRALQENWVTSFSRPIAGAILFAPGIGVRKFPWTFGNKWGVVTQATITHNPNPPHVGSIKPDSPFWSALAFRFAPELLTNSIESQSAAYPSNIKTLMFSGGDKEDVYAKSYVLREWADAQNSLRQNEHADPILNVRCPHAAHEMDNEPTSFGGDDVRSAAATFAAAIAKSNQQPQTLNLSTCFLISGVIQTQ